MIRADERIQILRSRWLAEIKPEPLTEYELRDLVIEVKRDQVSAYNVPDFGNEYVPNSRTPLGRLEKKYRTPLYKLQPVVHKIQMLYQRSFNDSQIVNRIQTLKML